MFSVSESSTGCSLGTHLVVIGITMSSQNRALPPDVVLADLCTYLRTWRGFPILERFPHSWQEAPDNLSQVRKIALFFRGHGCWFVFPKPMTSSPVSPVPLRPIACCRLETPPTATGGLSHMVGSLVRNLSLAALMSFPCNCCVYFDPSSSSFIWFWLVGIMDSCASPMDAHTFTKVKEDIVLFNITVKPSCFHRECGFISQNTFSISKPSALFLCTLQTPSLSGHFQYKHVLFKSKFFSSDLNMLVVSRNKHFKKMQSGVYALVILTA